MDNVEKLKSPIEEIEIPVVETRVYKELDNCKTVVKTVIQVVEGKFIE